MTTKYYPITSSEYTDIIFSMDYLNTQLEKVFTHTDFDEKKYGGYKTSFTSFYALKDKFFDEYTKTDKKGVSESTLKAIKFRAESLKSKTQEPDFPTKLISKETLKNIKSVYEKISNTISKILKKKTIDITIPKEKPKKPKEKPKEPSKTTEPTPTEPEIPEAEKLKEELKEDKFKKYLPFIIGGGVITLLGIIFLATRRK